MPSLALVRQKIVTEETARLTALNQALGENMPNERPRVQTGKRCYWPSKPAPATCRTPLNDLALVATPCTAAVSNSAFRYRVASVRESRARFSFRKTARKAPPVLPAQR
jgi:hypothetical protein